MFQVDTRLPEAELTDLLEMDKKVGRKELWKV